MKNAKLIGLSIVGLFIVGGAIYGSLSVYNSRINAAKVNISIKKISKKYDELTAQKDYSKKLKDLENLENDYQEYLNSGNTDSKVTNEYQNDIIHAKSYFEKQANIVVTKNTTRKLKNETKTTLTAKIKNLKTVLVRVKRERGTVYTASEVKSYKSRIKKLITKYNNKINKLAKTVSAQDKSASATGVTSATTKNSVQSTSSASVVKSTSSSTSSAIKTSVGTTKTEAVYRSRTVAASAKTYSSIKSATTRNSLSSKYEDTNDNGYDGQTTNESATSEVTNNEESAIDSTSVN